MIAVGSSLGPYEIVGQLRSGGMANLFLGSRSGPGGFRRHVVIKAIKAHLASHEDFVRMFLDEGRIAARIQHPNVVRIEELGEAEGTYYLVMEHVHGVALSELLAGLANRGRRLTVAAAVSIAAAAASGLEAAHETRGDDGRLLHVVHRDVSPQNVLLGALGQVKVIDFGIAKARDRLHVTDHATGGLKGKLRYMAPEQLLRSEVDRRSDVYALAVVLWEMLTMRRLFQGKSDAEVIQRIQRGDFSPPGAFATVPHALDDAVLAALSRDPNRRPASAAEFRALLRAAAPDSISVDPMEIAAMAAAVCGDLFHERAALLPGVSDGWDPNALARAFDELTIPIIDEFDDQSTVERDSLPPPRISAVAPAPDDIQYVQPSEHSLSIASLYEVQDSMPTRAMQRSELQANHPAFHESLPLTTPGGLVGHSPPPSPAPNAPARVSVAALVGVALLGLMAGAVIVLALLLFFG